MADRRSYESSSIERFRLAAAQLEQIAVLIGDDTVSRSRMAVVLLDNLADNLLYRHLSTILTRAGSSNFNLEPQIRLPKKQLEALLVSFPKKVDLVAEYEATHSLSRHRKMAPEDWTVLRITHRYRNTIYHRDTHNPALVGLLARLMLQASCSRFISTQAGGWATSGVLKELGDLNRYELVDEHGMFWPQKAAKRFTTLLSEGLEVTLHQGMDTGRGPPLQSGEPP